MHLTYDQKYNNSIKKLILCGINSFIQLVFSFPIQEMYKMQNDWVPLMETE